MLSSILKMQFRKIIIIKLRNLEGKYNVSEKGHSNKIIFFPETKITNMHNSGP